MIYLRRAPFFRGRPLVVAFRVGCRLLELGVRFGDGRKGRCRGGVRRVRHDVKVRVAVGVARRRRVKAIAERRMNIVGN